MVPASPLGLNQLASLNGASSVCHIGRCSQWASSTLALLSGLFSISKGALLLAKVTQYFCLVGLGDWVCLKWCPCGRKLPGDLPLLLWVPHGRKSPGDILFDVPRTWTSCVSSCWSISGCWSIAGWWSSSFFQSFLQALQLQSGSIGGHPS